MENSMQKETVYANDERKIWKEWVGKSLFDIDEYNSIINVTTDSVQLRTEEKFREELYLFVELEDKVVAFPFPIDFNPEDFLKDEDLLIQGHFRLIRNEYSSDNFDFYGECYICFCPKTVEEFEENIDDDQAIQDGMHPEKLTVEKENNKTT